MCSEGGRGARGVGREIGLMGIEAAAAFFAIIATKRCFNVCEICANDDSTPRENHGSFGNGFAE